MKNKFFKILEPLAFFYIFLSIANWDLNPNHWSTFSHILSALVVVITYTTLKD